VSSLGLTTYQRQVAVRQAAVQVAAELLAQRSAQAHAYQVNVAESHLGAQGANRLHLLNRPLSGHLQVRVVSLKSELDRGR
jgi:hypothetical protein